MTVGFLNANGDFYNRTKNGVILLDVEICMRLC